MLASHIKAGDKVVYRGNKGKVVRFTFPRHGYDRVVFERESDGQRYVVQVRRLTAVPQEAQQ